ncbi:MAG TPA: carboxymuconolactone decarboxylase family protein [Myxococcota bacterium]|nr:carboxymuconolactone decarboxylase family protein [Myxococcota bacterium]
MTKRQYDIEAREAEICGHPPRILPLDAEDVIASALQNTERLRVAAAGGSAPPSAPVAASEVPELVLTLLRHPALYERLTEMAIALQGRGALTARDRELAVLRVGWLCQAPYEWGEHVRLARRAGLTSEEIERVTRGSSTPGWTDHEAAILRAAEELHERAMISDATWRVLSDHLDERQLIELPILIGQFTLVAYLQNALRLRLGNGNVGLKAR